MKSWKRILADKWASSALILLGVLALAGAVGVYVSRNVAADNASRTHHSVDTAKTSETVQKKTSPPLKIGSIARIGSNYSVTVTKVNVYEDTDTQYLGAVLKATYLGKGSGDPRNDLTAKYTAANAPATAPAVGESECKGNLGEPDLSDLNGSQSLPNGGSKTYVACIKLPTSKVDDGKVSIETSAANHRAFWTTDGAETKKAPPPKPKVVLAPPPGAKPTIDPDTVHDLKKNIKKAKKARDVLDKQIKAYKKLPDHKKKKLKKFEKQREKLDDAIDDMEKVENLLDP
jgi:hypothetical protein